MTQTITVKASVDRFPGTGGWHFVRMPRKYTDNLTQKGAWGFVRIRATLGATTWNTSLLPYGDGSYFVALNAKIRKAEKLVLGNTTMLEIHLTP